MVRHHCAVMCSTDGAFAVSESSVRTLCASPVLQVGCHSGCAVCALFIGMLGKVRLRGAPRRPLPVVADFSVRGYSQDQYHSTECRTIFYGFMHLHIHRHADNASGLGATR